MVYAYKDGVIVAYLWKKQLENYPNITMKERHEECV